MTQHRAYPSAGDSEKVGSYPAKAKAGGGYVWDEVLEYRVWCCPRLGAEDLENGSDYYYAFETFEAAQQMSQRVSGAKEPLALILQREYLDEPARGTFVHVRSERICEWPVDLLKRPRRSENTIRDFLSPDAPENRLAILRGEAGSDG